MISKKVEVGPKFGADSDGEPSFQIGTATYMTDTWKGKFSCLKKVRILWFVAAEQHDADETAFLPGHSLARSRYYRKLSYS